MEPLANGNFDLSVIVCFYNMRREAARTLFTLSRAYQKGAENLGYEVIAVDNGSPKPLVKEEVEGFGPEFRHEFFETESDSPVEAVNRMVEKARAERIIVMIDGAHMLSPGVFQGAMRAFEIFENPFAVTVPFHLGPGLQNQTQTTHGYNQVAEDLMLDKVNWRSDGYELYKVAGAFSDGSMGWFGRLFESSCFAMKKSAYGSLGGFDPAFVSPGGGLVALDFFHRAVSDPSIEYVMLLGEATFHQFHGGVASNAPISRHPFPVFSQEYEKIHGQPFQPLDRRPFYLGDFSEQALAHSVHSAKEGLQYWARKHQEGK